MAASEKTHFPDAAHQGTDETDESPTIWVLSVLTVPTGSLFQFAEFAATISRVHLVTFLIFGLMK